MLIAKNTKQGVIIKNALSLLIGLNSMLIILIISSILLFPLSFFRFSFSMLYLILILSSSIRLQYYLNFIKLQHKWYYCQL